MSDLVSMFFYTLFFLSLNCCLANGLHWADRDSLRWLQKTLVLVVNLNVYRTTMEIGQGMILLQRGKTEKCLKPGSRRGFCLPSSYYPLLYALVLHIKLMVLVCQLFAELKQKQLLQAVMQNIMKVTLVPPLLFFSQSVGAFLKELVECI